MQASLLILLAMLGITTASTWQAAPYTLFREKRGKRKRLNAQFCINQLILKFQLPSEPVSSPVTMQ